MYHEKIENLHQGIEVINKHQVEIVETEKYNRKKNLAASSQ